MQCNVSFQNGGQLVNKNARFIYINTFFRYGEYFLKVRALIGFIYQLQKIPVEEVIFLLNSRKFLLTIYSEIPVSMFG